MHWRVPQLRFGNCLTTPYATILCTICNQIKSCLSWGDLSRIRTQGCLVSRLCALSDLATIWQQGDGVKTCRNIKSKWWLHATTMKKMGQQIQQDLKQIHRDQWNLTTNVASNTNTSMAWNGGQHATSHHENTTSNTTSTNNISLITMDNTTNTNDNTRGRALATGALATAKLERRAATETSDEDGGKS